MNYCHGENMQVVELYFVKMYPFPINYFVRVILDFST